MARDLASTNPSLTLNHLNLSHASKDGRAGSAFGTQRAAGAGELFSPDWILGVILGIFPAA